MRHGWMQVIIITSIIGCDEGGHVSPSGTVDPVEDAQVQTQTMVDMDSPPTAGEPDTTIDMGMKDLPDAQPNTDSGKPVLDATSADMAIDAGVQDQGLADAFVPIACSDGVDNDEDGKTDYPLDPGCDSPTDLDETDPDRLACADELDNDGDGQIDHPNDPGCASPTDPNESNICADGISYEDITGQTRVESSTRGRPAQLNICRNNRAPEAVYLFTLRRPISRLRIDTVGSSFDTLLAVRRRCDAPDSEIACNDDISPGRRVSEILLNAPPPGDYFIFVDGHGGSAGDFILNIKGELGFGEPCVANDDPDGAWLACGTGRVCRDGLCQPTVCADGLDNDGDGIFDYPSEPGCTDRDDDDETDPAQRAQCSDGLDNDNDGLIDYPSDPHCDAASDNEEQRPPDCRNGLDDDQDGFIDLDDPGCNNDPERDFEFNTPLCRNGRDDDQDDLIDYPNDPGCDSADDTDERDPDVMPECFDQIDNDEDGLTDFPADSDSCTYAADPTEDDPCLRLEARNVTGMSRTRGSTLESTNDFEASCAQGTGNESVLLWQVLPDRPLRRFTLKTTDSDMNTVISVRTGCQLNTELGCNDDDPDLVNNFRGISKLEIGPVEGGTDLYIFVDGARGDNGIWRLRLSAELSEGANCEGQGAYVCAEGLSCTEEPGGRFCRRPACDDGRDNDNDALIDYPNDPGCDQPDDDDEIDPLVPTECKNGQDDDQDGLTDFPQDPGCTSAADRSERPDCNDGIDNDGDGQTDFDDGNGQLGGNQDGGCECFADPSEKNQPACRDRCDNDGDGFIDLEDPGCLGNPEGLTEFNEPQCKDNRDNNNDGRSDYPNDPGCRFANDPIENQVAAPPQCADGIDNDQDGAIDFAGGDTGCIAAADTDERPTCETELAVLPETGTAIGTTASGMPENQGSCGIDTGAPDQVYIVNVPYAAQVVARSVNEDFDSIIYARSSCWALSRCPEPAVPGGVAQPENPPVSGGAGMPSAGVASPGGAVHGGDAAHGGEGSQHGGALADVAGQNGQLHGGHQDGQGGGDGQAGQTSGPVDEPCVPGQNTELACDNNPVLFTSELNFEWSGGDFYLFIDGFGTQFGPYELRVVATYPEGGQCGPTIRDFAQCTLGTECLMNLATGYPTCQRP